MTDSTKDSTSPKSIASKNSGFSRSCGTNSIWNVGLMSICTEEFKVCDLRDFGGVLFPVESVTSRMYYVAHYRFVWWLCVHSNLLCCCFVHPQMCHVVVMCTDLCKSDTNVLCGCYMHTILSQKCVLWLLYAHVRNMLCATHMTNVLCDKQICHVIVLCTHKCVMWLFCAQICANITQMCSVVVMCTHTNVLYVQHT